MKASMYISTDQGFLNFLVRVRTYVSGVQAQTLWKLYIVTEESSSWDHAHVVEQKIMVISGVHFLPYSATLYPA